MIKEPKKDKKIPLKDIYPVKEKNIKKMIEYLKKQIKK
jgi:hypothetical protein